jgi:hypothetical protein
LNLLHLEHAIIRIKTRYLFHIISTISSNITITIYSSVLDFPTFPGSDIAIPNSIDLKYYANIFPSIAEPRVSFTLALPFKTSPLIHAYKRDGLTNQIRFEYLYIYLFIYIYIYIYIINNIIMYISYCNTTIDLLLVNILSRELSQQNRL